MNTVFVLTCLDNIGELTVKVFKEKKDGVEYAMTKLFGNEWFDEVDDDGEIAQAYDSISEDYGYADSNDNVWTLFESEVM